MKQYGMFCLYESCVFIVAVYLSCENNKQCNSLLVVELPIFGDFVIFCLFLCLSQFLSF